MTIELPLSGVTFEAELVVDVHGTLWVAQRSAAIGVRTEHSRLADMVKLGWRIVRASPEEQALLDAHGLGSVSSRPSSAPQEDASGGPDV